MKHIYNSFDLGTLREFGADPDHKTLQKDYDKYRDAWVKADRKGPLPTPTLLDLAKKYPIKAEKSE